MWPGRAKVCFRAGAQMGLKHEMRPGRAKVCFSAGVRVWLKHEMGPGKAKVCFRVGDAAAEGSAWPFGQRLKTGRSGRLTSNSSFYGPSARNVLEQVPSCRFAAENNSRVAALTTAAHSRADFMSTRQGRRPSPTLNVTITNPRCLIIPEYGSMQNKVVLWFGFLAYTYTYNQRHVLPLILDKEITPVAINVTFCPLFLTKK